MTDEGSRFGGGSCAVYRSCRRLAARFLFGPGAMVSVHVAELVAIGSVVPFLSLLAGEQGGCLSLADRPVRRVGAHARTADDAATCVSCSAWSPRDPRTRLVDAEFRYGSATSSRRDPARTCAALFLTRHRTSAISCQLERECSCSECCAAVQGVTAAFIAVHHRAALVRIAVTSSHRGGRVRAHYASLLR